MKQILACALAACVITVTATAWGYWSVESAAGGNAAAQATTVSQGPTPTANAVGTTVTVSWSASTLATGPAATGYLVKRYNSSTGVLQTILSACHVTITALSCIESSVPAGSWKYAVTPKFADNWVGQESSQSGTVTVIPPDTTGPANDITLSSVTGGAFKSANTIYYRGSAVGSFTLTNAVTDAGSGPASSQTATLGNTPTNWTHTGSTVSTPTGGPYVSNTFSWTASTTSAPTEVVAGRDVAGNITYTNLSFLNDSTAPSAGTISYLDGYQPGHSVPVTFTTGTDGGSGLATKQLQRQSAPLTGGSCGSWTGYSDRGPDSPTSIYTDSSVAAGNCYMYRYVFTDRVGNQHIATSASVSKIDYSEAVDATSGILSHWRLGENATAIATDTFTGSNGTLMTSRNSDSGHTWTYYYGTDNEQINTNRVSSTDAGRAIYGLSVVPSSPDYAVEADIHYKGVLAGDKTGVIGRMTPGISSTVTYYSARYEQADQTWNLIENTGTTPTNLAKSSTQALTVGQTYNVRLEMTGTTRTSLRLFVNDVLLLSATDTTSPFTVVGIAGFAEGEGGSATVKSTAAGLHLDNFKVTNLRAADTKVTNHAAYVNDPTRSVTGALTGDSDTAAQFDGVNDYVQAQVTASMPTGAGVRSVEAWFKTSSSAQQVLYGYGTLANTQEFGLLLGASGTTMIAWGFGGGNDKTFTMPSAMNDGQWHHVVQTYSGTIITIYIDGVALATQAATRATVIDTYGFGIGAVVNPGDPYSTDFFNGSIDEVSFYTTALSQAVVTNHYQLGTVTVPEPIVTTTGVDLAYIENGTPLLAPAITITDADSANLTAATVDMTTNYLNGQDTLAFTNQNGITGTWTAGTGVMALSGTATVAQYQTALRSITYNNNSDYPNTATRAVAFSVSDGTNTSNTASKNITITAVNDAPTGADGSATLNEDASSSFATADFGMTDPTDNGAHTLTAVKITTLPAFGTLKLNAVNVTAGQTVSAANITSGLLTYTPALDANGTSYVTFTFQVQDTGGTTNSGVDLDASANTFTFNVTAVNDAPVNTVPATQSTLPNTAKVFSTGNLISIGDVDVSGSSWQVQLVSTNGATTLSTVTGLAFTVGDGTADATMTFTGTIASINTALNGLSFNPTTSFTGAASLQIVTSDQGNTGTGGTLTDSDTITINVSGRPVVTATVADLAFTENGSAVALDTGITVADTDSTITGATVSITTNRVNPGDTLSVATQLGISGSWNAGTGVLTMTGTASAASYQTVMRTIMYSNTANNLVTNNHNVNFVVSDAIGVGNTATRQVAITAVNDAPVNTVPATQTTAANTAEVFTGGSLISITDDATSGSMQVQLVSTNGATTLSGTTGLTFSVGDGSADATMTFTGTVAAVNTALAGLSFAPRADWVGTANLQIVTSDQGNTGSGGTLTDDDTVAITVTSSLGIFAATSGVGVTGGSASYVNPTYTVVGEGTGIGTTTDQIQYLYTTLTGDGTLTAQVASITNPCPTYGYSGVMMRDSLATNSMFAMADQKESGDNFAEQRYRTTNGGTSVNTQTAATVPEWVRITRTGNSFTTFRSVDGSAWTAISVARTIAMGSTIYVGLAVTSTTDACFNTSTFNNVSLTQPSTPPVLAASGGTTAHTENVPVVVDGGITVADVDDTNMESGTVTVGTGYTAGQDVLAFTNQNGITGSYSAPTLTLTGSATKANWQTALRSITYNNTSNTPNIGNRTINFVVNDGSSNSNTGAKTVSVATVNDAPVNTVPGGQTTTMNTAEVFTGGSLISITDDASSGDMRVQLVSTNGATTLSTLTGLSFTVGDGTADATMTFDGTVAEVNAALSGLSFNPTTSFTGAASLQIVTSDQGNTGTGGTLTDDDTVAITVTSGPNCATELVTNGGFENGATSTPWVESPTDVVTNTGSVGARTGSWKTLLGGSGGNNNETVTQSITIPSGCNMTLSYYLRITTSEGSHPFDYFRVMVDGVEQQEYSDSNAGASYVLRTVDLSAFAGDTISLQFLSDEDSSNQTSFWLDDVSITGVASGGSYYDTIWGESSLLNYYRMDDSTGTAIDDLETADNNGTSSGTPTLAQAGAITGNSSVLFDGTNDYVSITRQISTNFSIEFWFKSTQGIGTTGQWPQYAGLVDANTSGSNADFGISLSSTGVINAGVGTPDETITSGTGYNDGNWHHVVMTRDGTSGTFILYVDGAGESSTVGPTGALTATANINFGRIAAGTNYYQGNLDEIAIYNTVLSAGTVTAHYDAR